MAPFARDLGDDGPPFRWDVERRAQLRAELDACFFHLYGLDRDDTEYVLGTFPIANRKDPGLTSSRPRRLRRDGDRHRDRPALRQPVGAAARVGATARRARLTRASNARRSRLRVRGAADRPVHLRP